MTTISLDIAKQALEAWLAADLAIAKGKSYSMNGRTLTLVDVREIREQILYWERKVAALSSLQRNTSYSLVTFNS